MQISGAPDLASKSQGLSDGPKVKLKDRMDMTRCLCGSSLPTDSMIKVFAVVFTTSLCSVHLDLFVVHKSQPPYTLFILIYALVQGKLKSSTVDSV